MKCWTKTSLHLLSEWIIVLNTHIPTAWTADQLARHPGPSEFNFTVHFYASNGFKIFVCHPNIHILVFSLLWRLSLFKDPERPSSSLCNTHQGALWLCSFKMCWGRRSVNAGVGKEAGKRYNLFFPLLCSFSFQWFVLFFIDNI